MTTQRPSATRLKTTQKWKKKAEVSGAVATSAMATDSVAGPNHERTWFTRHTGEERGQQPRARHAVGPPEQHAGERQCLEQGKAQGGADQHAKAVGGVSTK